MSQIAVDFILGSALSSRLIAYWGEGYGGYSHVASLLDDGTYIDARDDGKGVQVRDPKAENWTKRRRATLEVTPHEYGVWEAGLRSKLDLPYGKGDIVGFITGKNVHDAGHWICSALAINQIQHVARFWPPTHDGYVPYPLPIPVHQISPNAALLILATAGFTIEDEILR